MTTDTPAWAMEGPPDPSAWPTLTDSQLAELALRTIAARNAHRTLDALNYDADLYHYLVRRGREMIYLRANRALQLKHNQVVMSREDGQP